MNVALSRRVAAVALTETILALSPAERFEFAAAVDAAESFSKLAKRWQDLILAAEREAGLR